MASILKLSIIFCLSAAQIMAKDLGTYGHTFSIQEEDLLQYLMQKVHSVSEEESIMVQSKVRDHFIRSFKEPQEVEYLAEAKTYRVFYFDPTICVKQDIKDHEGCIIIKKDICINPLEQVSLNEELLFFDATQESHLTWAKSQPKTAKWIIVKGKPLELEEKEKRPIFFDQLGILTKKLTIRQIPAKVSQEGLKLKIEEIPIREALCVSS